MIAETQFTVEDFQKRIQTMTDEKLVQMGKAARYMADTRNSADKRTVRDVYVTQLRFCREEWKRRHFAEFSSAKQSLGSRVNARYRAPRHAASVQLRFSVAPLRCPREF
jgi:hypothetical protein